MADKPTQYSKNQIVKDLEKQINDIETKYSRIIALDPKLIEESLKAEEDNSNLIVQVEKWINIINKKVKNYVVTCVYRPPDGKTSTLNEYLENVFQTANAENKNIFVTGDFNVNCFNYESDSEVKEFYDNIFSNGSIPLINKETRVTTSTSTLIDNICTNVFFEPSLKKAIIISSISDHFPVIAALNISKEPTKEKYVIITKRVFNAESKQNFFNPIRPRGGAMMAPPIIFLLITF